MEHIYPLRGWSLNTPVTLSSTRATVFSVVWPEYINPGSGGQIPSIIHRTIYILL